MKIDTHQAIQSQLMNGNINIFYFEKLLNLISTAPTGMLAFIKAGNLSLSAVI